MDGLFSDGFDEELLAAHDASLLSSDAPARWQLLSRWHSFVAASHNLRDDKRKATDVLGSLQGEVDKEVGASTAPARQITISEATIAVSKALRNGATADLQVLVQSLQTDADHPIWDRDESSDAVLFLDRASAELLQDDEDRGNDGNSGRSSKKQRVASLPALHTAALYSQVDTIKWLLDAGASPLTCSKSGDTALHIAAVSGCSKAIELLIAAGTPVGAKNGGGFYAGHGANEECRKLIDSARSLERVFEQLHSYAEDAARDAARRAKEMTIAAARDEALQAAEAAETAAGNAKRLAKEREQRLLKRIVHYQKCISERDSIIDATVERLEDVAVSRCDLRILNYSEEKPVLIQAGAEVSVLLVSVDAWGNGLRCSVTSERARQKALALECGMVSSSASSCSTSDYSSSAPVSSRTAGSVPDETDLQSKSFEENTEDEFISFEDVVDAVDECMPPPASTCTEAFFDVEMSTACNHDVVASSTIINDTPTIAHALAAEGLDSGLEKFSTIISFRAVVSGEYRISVRRRTDVCRRWITKASPLRIFVSSAEPLPETIEVCPLPDNVAVAGKPLVLDIKGKDEYGNNCDDSNRLWMSRISIGTCDIDSNFASQEDNMVPFTLYAAESIDQRCWGAGFVILKRAGIYSLQCKYSSCGNTDRIMILPVEVLPGPPHPQNSCVYIQTESELNQAKTGGADTMALVCLKDSLNGYAISSAPFKMECGRVAQVSVKLRDIYGNYTASSAVTIRFLFSQEHTQRSTDMGTAAFPMQQAREEKDGSIIPVGSSGECTAGVYAGILSTTTAGDYSLRLEMVSATVVDSILVTKIPVCPGPACARTSSVNIWATESPNVRAKSTDGGVSRISVNAGCHMSFEVSMMDVYSNVTNRLNSESSILLKILRLTTRSCEDIEEAMIPNGTLKNMGWSSAVQMTKAGKYVVVVLIDGEEIARHLGGNTSIHVSPGPMHAIVPVPPTSSGEESNHDPWRALFKRRKQARVLLRCVDAYGNSVVAAEKRLVLRMSPISDNGVKTATSERTGAGIVFGSCVPWGSRESGLLCGAISPTVSGWCRLMVSVDGIELPASPFTVFVQ